MILANMTTLFFSYSHTDESLRDELEKRLTILKRQGLIDTWHDRKIIAGDDLDHTIDGKLEEADVILLLISPDFLASNYCYDVEFQRALERHKEGSARAIAVILRPCEWKETPVAKFLVTPKDGKPITKWPDLDDAMLDVAQAIRRALPSSAKRTLPPAQATTSNPAKSEERPRSSNLRIRQNFSEVDIQNFLEESFEYILNYFEGSLAELEDRQSEIQTKLKRLDANCFTASMYRHGQSASGCTIRQGSGAFRQNGITYLGDDSGSQSSFNEMLTVEVGDQCLSFKPMDMGMLVRVGNSTLTQEGAAEFLWSKFLEPLQR